MQTYCDNTDNSTNGDPTDGIINDLDFTDLDTIITGGAPTIVVSYHSSQADADANTNPIAFPYENIFSPTTQTLYARLSVGDCYDTTSFDILINPAPIIVNAPPNLTLCDNYNDGDNANGLVQEFDFTPQIPIIQGAQIGVTVTFYQYLSQAETGNLANQLSAPYANTDSYAQAISFRIEDDATGCYNTGTFHLYVTETVPYTQPQDLYLCDADFDQIATFDIASQTPTITLDPDILVSYHLSQNDMENNLAPIVEPQLSAFNNTANPQTIYVRIEDPDEDCIAYDSFTLNVLLGPTMLDPILPFNECADVEDLGFTEFMLTDKNDELLNGQTNVDVFYYETEDLANAGAAGTNLDSPYANTTAYTQIMWVVLVDNVTHCSSIVANFDLIVHDSPNITWTIDTLEVCDPDADGFEFFDLSLADTQIAGTLGNAVTVSYYETQTDADLDNNAIIDDQEAIPGLQYANIDSWTQIIYARATNTTTGCYDTVTLILQVNPTPQINLYLMI